MNSFTADFFDKITLFFSLTLLTSTYLSYHQLIFCVNYGNFYLYFQSFIFISKNPALVYDLQSVCGDWLAVERCTCIVDDPTPSFI